jgi:integrase
VKKPPRCERRGGQWYYRRRVPLDLVSVLGFAEYRESLKTPDIEVARMRAALRDAEVAVELQAARHQLAQRQHQEPATVDTLSPEALRYVREAVRARALEFDEQVRLSRPDEDGLTHYESTLADEYVEASEALARGQVAVRPDERARVADVLRSVGVSINPDAVAWPDAAYRAVEGRLLALEDVRERMQGRPRPTPEVPPPPAELLPLSERQASAGTSLADVATRWKAERKPAPATIINIDRAVKAVEAIAGKGCAVGDITRDHVQAYKDQMVDGGKLYSTTIKDRLGHVRMLLGYAEDNGLVTSNAALKVKYRAPKNTVESYIPFDAADLTKLFSGPVHATGARPAGGKGEAAYWVPLLALHTGARREELCQLLVADVRERDGISFLALTEENEHGQRDGSKALKTDSSAREVPLHPRLIELGFLAYVEERRQAGDRRVFPLVQSAPGKPLGDAWGKWFGRYLRERGVVHEKKVFHSFRATLKTALVSKGAPLHTHDAITGHVTPGVGAGYVYVSLEDKLAVLRLVSFDC